MSPPSPEALYHAIPQAPVAANSVILDPEIELDDEGSELGDPISLSSSPPLGPPPPPVDTRIAWIHFVLGCSVLLPWNGVSGYNLCLQVVFKSTNQCYPSHDHCYTLLSLPVSRFSPKNNV